MRRTKINAAERLYYEEILAQFVRDAMDHAWQCGLTTKDIVTTVEEAAINWKTPND